MMEHSKGCIHGSKIACGGCPADDNEFCTSDWALHCGSTYKRPAEDNYIQRYHCTLRVGYIDFHRQR